jgi:hypothetical protein
MSLVEPVDKWIGTSPIDSHQVLLSKKHTYMRQRSQVYVGAPEQSRIVLHKLFPLPVGLKRGMLELLVLEAIVLFFVTLVIVVEGVRDNRFVAAIGIQRR